MIPSEDVGVELPLETRLTDAGAINYIDPVRFEEYGVWRRQFLAGVTTLTNYDELHKLTI